MKPGDVSLFDWIAEYLEKTSLKHFYEELECLKEAKDGKSITMLVVDGIHVHVKVNVDLTDNICSCPARTFIRSQPMEHKS